MDTAGAPVARRPPTLDHGRRQRPVWVGDPTTGGDPEVCPETAAGAADQRNDPVIGCEDGRAEGFDEIDARVEMRVGAVGRLEPERARTEGLRDLGLGLWPDESAPGGVTRAWRGLSDAVGPNP